MPCYTTIQVEDLDDTPHNRKAREFFKLPLEGALSQYDAGRVKKRAGMYKAQEQVRKLDPRAVVVIKGDKLVVTVQR
jgi:hypothetical protein